MKKFLIAVLFLALSVNSFSAERGSLSERLQGIWNCVALSQDKGMTVQTGRGEYFATVTDRKVKSADGKILTVNNVRYLEEKGVEYTCVDFVEISDVVWAISFVDDEIIMVQTIQNGQEVIRVLFTVNK